MRRKHKIQELREQILILKTFSRMISWRRIYFMLFEVEDAFYNLLHTFAQSITSLIPFGF